MTQVLVWDSRDVFKLALDQVHIHDGHCSSKSLTGIKLALEESLPGSYLFVFTDAGSNDLHLLGEVISLCQEKQSQILFISTGNICATTAEYYYRIARASNGQVFMISKEQIGQVIEYVKENIKGDRSVITNQVASPGQLTNVKFYIDGNVEYAIVSAFAEHGVSLIIKDNLNSDLISGFSRIMWTENVKVLKLEILRTGGAYVAQVYGSTDINVMVFVRTDFTFEYGFSNKQEYSLSTTETQPTIGTPTNLMIFVRDERNSVRVQVAQILDMNENLIANLSLTNMGGKVYATGQFVPPEHTFKVAVTAIGRSTRRPLRRIAKSPVAPIRPVTVAPKIVDSETYLKKREGSTVDISCRIQKGNPTPNIRWFFMKKGTRDYVQMRGTTNEVLRLTNVLVDNEGHYKCEAENTAGRAEHVVQLEVEVPPRIVFSPPNEPKYRGVEGDVIMKLSCNAEGHPKPIISWTIDNNTIGTDKSNHSYVEDGSLFVKNPVSENSNNTYVCVATNAAGEQRQTYEVLISEFEDYNQPEKKYGEVGKPFGINCSLPFTDPNSVRWFYNSVYLNVTGASIHWESASQANDGNYTCRVSDLSGAASVTVELTFGLPPTPSFGETVFEMEWDDTLQLLCVADLNMNGTYEWYRNGVRINDANEEELNVHQFGWGNYTCRAVNPFGSLNITYNIPSQDCVIDKKIWTTKKMPVIIDHTLAWPTFSHNQKFIVVPQSETLLLICQDEPPRGELVQPHSLNNSFTKFPSIRAIEATCDHEDTFLVDGVSQKISELDCILSVTPSVVSTGKQCLGKNTQMIDVGFYVDDLIKVYSSCLDTKRNLLLYTTVTMKGSDIPREAREPERPCKQVDDCCYETIELVSAEDIGFGAAEWETLKEPRNSVFYCRPTEYTFTRGVTTTSTDSWSEAVESSPSADSTENPSVQSSTTELPPHPETSWHDIEREVRNGPRMTVWSGAGNYTRVGDMMVPRYLWKVVKNLDEDMTVAIVHSNAQAPIPKLCADDCGSSSVLALFEPYGDRTYCCSLAEFKTAFNLPLAF